MQSLPPRKNPSHPVLFLALSVVILATVGAIVVSYASSPYDLVRHTVDRETFEGMSPVHQGMLTRLAAGSEESDAAGGLAVCWSEGTDSEVIQAFEATVADRNLSLFQFNDGSRWSSTATDGGGLGQGDPTVITWGIVPDGTFIAGFAGEPSASSDLIAFLDGIYGAGPGGSDLTQRPWFSLFETAFAAWSAFIGTDYVYEPNDDAVSLTSGTGILGVRPDVRIGGHFIDGSFNTLAYNFFPNNGDMVIDTGDSFYNSTFSNSLGLRNVLSHEHGHGLGFSHSCPINATKLMEPTISTSFTGPRSDDLLAGMRGYGDRFEFPVENDAAGDAEDLGSIAVGAALLRSALSIDDNSDQDYFTFTVPADVVVTVTVTPEGFPYLAGPQNPDGSCSAGTLYDPRNRSDLGFEIRGLSGANILASVDANVAGASESIVDFPLPEGAGAYFVRVFGDANTVQRYLIQFRVNAGASPPVAVCQDVVVSGSGPGCTVAVTPAQVDAGSSDPNNDPLTLVLEPAGPYSEGITAVSLIVSDPGGLADTCQADITVDCLLGPELQVDPVGVTFASVALGDTICETVTVRNLGDQDMDVFSITGCDSADFYLDLTGLATVVAPGDSTSFDVCFAPTSGGGDSCTVMVAATDSTAAIPVQVGAVTAVPGDAPGPGSLLTAIMPNPFAASAQIRFHLEEQSPVRLEIFDLRGRRVRSLLSGEYRPEGDNEARWDGRDDYGTQVTGGVYFIRLVAGSRVQVARVVRMP